MGEFKVAGHSFKSGKLDVFKQFHIARRIGPILAALEEGEQQNIFVAIAKALGQMDDADCEYVIFNCLAVVQIQQGQAWANIVAGNRMMFDFIGLQEMLDIVRHVLEDNFANFFSGLPQPSSTATSA